MPRDTSFDTITDDLLQRFINIESVLAGLATSTVPAHDGITVAAYPDLGLPMPSEPFPAIYNYISGLQPDYTQGSSIRRDVVTVASRILGGPLSPTYKTNPERAVYKLVTAFLNEFDYRPHLEDPTNSDSPFRYLSAQGASTRSVGRFTPYNYGDPPQPFAGIEIFSTVILQFNVARIG